eukprot:121959_1
MSSCPYFTPSPQGTSFSPLCGFSNRAVEILKACNVEFETFDVLEDSNTREAIKEYSQWPTIPQLYIGGEFVGGSDILFESFQNGDLKNTLLRAGARFIT